MSSLINKIASAIEMSFDIPEVEKKEAEITSDYLDQVINAINHAKEHLDIIYTPFKKAVDLPPEAVWEYRGAIRRYKDQIKDNFVKVKSLSMYALTHLSTFGSDTHIAEITNSFKDSIEDLSEQVEILMDALDKMKDANYKEMVLTAIDNVRKQCSETETLIKERALDFINSNILVKDWTSDLSKDLNLEIKRKVPYITQLFQERQDALGQGK